MELDFGESHKINRVVSLIQRHGVAEMVRRIGSMLFA